MSDWEEDLPIPSYDFDLRRAREIIDARMVMLMFLSPDPELFTAWDEPTSDSPRMDLTAWWKCKNNPHCPIWDNMVYYTLSPDKPDVVKPHGMRCEDRFGYVHDTPCDFEFLGYVIFRYTPQWNISFVYSYSPRRYWVDHVSPENVIKIDHPGYIKGRMTKSARKVQ